MDEITGFESIDGLQIGGRFNNITLTASVGNAASLDRLSTLLTSTRLPANTARAFTVTDYSGTFVAFNDGTAGFNSVNDGVVLLHDYTISTSNPISVI